MIAMMVTELVACSASVLLVRANAISSRSFIRSAMFNLELELDGRSRGRLLGTNLFLPCLPLPFLLRRYCALARQITPALQATQLVALL